MWYVFFFSRNVLHATMSLFQQVECVALFTVQLCTVLSIETPFNSPIVPIPLLYFVLREE